MLKSQPNKVRLGGIEFKRIASLPIIFNQHWHIAAHNAEVSVAETRNGSICRAAGRYRNPYTALQRQTAVTAYFPSKKSLQFVFTLQKYIVVMAHLISKQLLLFAFVLPRPGRASTHRFLHKTSRPIIK